MVQVDDADAAAHGAQDGDAHSGGADCSQPTQVDVNNIGEAAFSQSPAANSTAAAAAAALAPSCDSTAPAGAGSDTVADEAGASAPAAQDAAEPRPQRGGGPAIFTSDDEGVGDDSSGGGSGGGSSGGRQQPANLQGDMLQASPAPSPLAAPRQKPRVSIAARLSASSLGSSGDGPLSSSFRRESSIDDDDDHIIRPHKAKARRRTRVYSDRSTSTLPGEGRRSSAWRGRNSRQVSPRLFQKETGLANMERVYFAGDRFLRIWVKDTLNTIINLPWWQVITLFALSLIGSWLGFSLIWWLIWRYYDGNCLAEVSGYNSALLFSIETQTTIGYGSKHVTADCRLGTFILIIQSVVGPIIDAIWLGLVFQKICRPHARQFTLRFSHFACVCWRDGKRYLAFRIGDMRRKEPLAESSVRLIMFYEHCTREGEVVPYDQVPLDLGSEEELNSPMLMLPSIVAHCIDEDSPLYGLSRSDLLSIKAEFLLLIEGTIQTTGLPVHARTSYTPDEICFNYRFQNITTRLDNGLCRVDWSNFDTIELQHVSAEDVDDEDVKSASRPQTINTVRNRNGSVCSIVQYTATDVDVSPASARPAPAPSTLDIPRHPYPGAAISAV